tara:strand:+ start:43 stop:468 length:426 start_codon:yes stop_codon:yes gene_type:complete
MSKRENITAHIVSQISAISDVKSVTREPKVITELAATSFPHVMIETANEEREDFSFGNEIRRKATMDVLINVIVYSNNRDQSRNEILEKIEEKLALDTTLGGNALNSKTSEIIVREVGETAPYGQAAIVYTVEYYYTKGSV